MTIIVFAFLAVALLPIIVGCSAVALTRLHRHTARESCAGLLFHDISLRPRINRSHVSAQTFDDFISRLSAEKLSVITAGEYVRSIRNGTALPERAVVLAFDDGFESFCSTAAPVLSRNGFRASFFPVVNMIGASGSLDVFGPQRHAAVARLREMAALGHEIGSHTLSHPDLSRLEDALLSKELNASRKRLEDVAGTAVTTISFPYGSCTARVWAAAQEAGYDAGVVYGAKRLPHDDRLIYVQGTWAFDTVDDLMSRLAMDHRGNSAARAAVMPHFARGTALWRFRREYSLIRH